MIDRRAVSATIPAPSIVEPQGPAWPPGPASVVLARSDTPVERELIARWAAGRLDGGRTAGSPEEALAAADGDPSIVPVRVLWLPAEHDGDQRHRLRELPGLVRGGRLTERAQRRVLARAPERCRIVIGEPARRSELEARWKERAGEAQQDGFPAFVARQADIALERTERRVTGERYRAPRAVAEELATDARFIAATEQLARQLGRAPEGVLVDARAYLAEMATEQQRLARDLWAQWARFLYSRAYELSVDTAALERLRELNASHPLVFLPSHRSNLDGYVMASLLYEQGFPANHTLGGINMAFWPIGPLGRRTGVIWIRRSFRDNEIYKLALRHYLAYLVSKRFNLEWYIEGGRSRTGKLLPPRMGLFNYLADAVEDLGVRDVLVVPTSIVYDELQEVAEMTSESRGQQKQAEGLGWLLRFARDQRGSYGAAHVNFGEPIDLAEALRAHGSQPDDPAARKLARSKVAFEVCTRINRATPATAPALVALALLGVDDRALTFGEVREVLTPLLSYVDARDIPADAAARRLSEADGLRETLATLDEHGVVEVFDGGAEPVYGIGRDRELVAAFYRNMTVHWFVGRAIVELSLLRAAEDDDRDPVDAGWEEAHRLRDLLKFDFFFPERDEFGEDMRTELGLIEHDWRERGPRRLAELGDALRRSGALLAHRVLRSFIESHLIVADRLVALGEEAADVGGLKQQCLGLGRQYLLQRRVVSAEAISTHLFEAAIRLAGNRELLEGDGVGARRRAHAAELHDIQRRLLEVDRLDRERRA
jgi:glycerol-3-phosphate O-acyltransferase